MGPLIETPWVDYVTARSYLRLQSTSVAIQMLIHDLLTASKEEAAQPSVLKLTQFLYGNRKA